MKNVNDVYTVYVYFNSGNKICETWDLCKALTAYSRKVQEIYKESGYTVRMFRNDEQIAIFQN